MKFSIKKACFAAALSVSFVSLPTQASADVALWALETATGGQAVLMGTVHLLPDDDAWADKRIKRAVDAADMLVIEALTDQAGTTQVKRFAMTHGFRAPGSGPLSSELSADMKGRMTRIAADLDVPLVALERMQPWFAALNLTLASVMREGFASEQGAESWLRARVTKAGEDTGALEAPTAGLEALANLPGDLQIEMLDAAFAEVEAGGENIRALHNAWVRGDQDALSALILDPAQFNEAVHDAVLAQRNANWIAPILAFLETPEREFIAVGAAHMVGPGNLLDMLRDAGVQVQRLD